MFKNYFKVAWRNLVRHKAYSAINIAGFATGIACCLLMLLYVWDELSFDRHFPDHASLYRITADYHFGDDVSRNAMTQEQLAAALRTSYPQITGAATMRNWGSVLLRRTGDTASTVQTQNFNEEMITYTDSAFLPLLGVRFIAGNPQTSLAAPNSVVITESVAKKYFGETAAAEVLNQTLKFDNTDDAVITGIVADFPANSHLQFNIFRPMEKWEGWEMTERGDWTAHKFYTYARLRSGEDPTAFAEKLSADLLRQHLTPRLKVRMTATDYYRVHLQPVTDIRLFSNLDNELFGNGRGDLRLVYGFSALALTLLAIAVINFMNLSTARASQRATEVGVRKVLGSTRGALVMQFLTESFITTTIAFAFALLFVELALPFFNSLAGKTITLGSLGLMAIPAMLGFLIVVSLLAGSYPAFYLSRFQPAAVMKGSRSLGVKGKTLRSALVVFQFAASIVLIITTAVIYNQLSFTQEKPLGFDRQHVLLTSVPNKPDAYRAEVQKISGVVSVAATPFVPIPNTVRYMIPVTPEAGQGRTDAPQKPIKMFGWWADFDYLQTMGITLAEGRDFSREVRSDSAACLINESAVVKLGWTDKVNPIGKTLSFKDYGQDTARTFTVIGVIKDFHFNSLRDPIKPMLMRVVNVGGRLSIRYAAATDLKTLIKACETVFRKASATDPFTYSLMSDDVGKFYDTEQRIGKSAAAFAVLTVIVACLGLFGLAAFTAEQRTKEIGIRKILGASVQSITALLTKDFLRLVVIAFLVAAPLGWYAGTRLLENYAYRIELTWPLFATVGAAVLMIAALTV
ncbi:MAG: ABC transporter permease, partial [Rhizobacter sp.]|nr:ABC transporter permease [Chlorobiales bacterium]